MWNLLSFSLKYLAAVSWLSQSLSLNGVSTVPLCPKPLSSSLFYSETHEWTVHLYLQMCTTVRLLIFRFNKNGARKHHAVCTIFFFPKYWMKYNFGGVPERFEPRSTILLCSPNWALNVSEELQPQYSNSIIQVLQWISSFEGLKYELPARVISWMSGGILWETGIDLKALAGVLLIAVLRKGFQGQGLSPESGEL